jgi:hypothetical protein
MSPKALKLALTALAVLAFPSAASAEPALRAFTGGIGAWIAGSATACDGNPSLFPGGDLYCGGEQLEILVSPGLITFFCNPYSLAGRTAGMSAGFSLDPETAPEFGLGLLGRLHESLRIGVFSTVSAISCRDAIAPPDRLEGLRDLRMNRLSLLLALVPLPGLGVGAGGGASVTESSRDYDFEFLLEARIRF